MTEHLTRVSIKLQKAEAYIDKNRLHVFDMRFLDETVRKNLKVICVLCWII